MLSGLCRLCEERKAVVERARLETLLREVKGRR
jgi:hypothetical protein